MQALILAGGKGTRLRPLTVYTPKPVVPVVNRPFLLYQIDVLRKAGITDITLSLSYQPDKIQHLLGNGSEFGVNLRYVTEPSPMGTAGGYRFAAESPAETTVVFNGDILTDIDIERLIKFHRAKSSAATLAVCPVDDPSRFGLVDTAENGSIRGFIEKPATENVKESGVNTINAGIYILEQEIYDLIPEGVNRSFEYDVFPEILDRKLPFFASVMDEYWLDIGTPTNYLQAHHDLLNGRLEGPERDGSETSDVAIHADIDKRSVLGAGCIVKPGVSIVNSVIGPGVHIEEKASIENSVIWSHSRISSAAEIRGSVIGRGCHIGRNAIVSEGSMIGDKTTLTDYTNV